LGVIVGDGGKVVVGVEVGESASVKISVGEGDGLKGCRNTGVHEDKIVARITIIMVCNFIFPTFSAPKRPPH